MTDNLAENRYELGKYWKRFFSSLDRDSKIQYFVRHLSYRILEERKTARSNQRPEVKIVAYALLHITLDAISIYIYIYLFFFL